MFGAAFDGRVVRRFWGFVTPHRRQVWVGVAAVIVFTLTQIAIPLVLRYAIDDAPRGGAIPGSGCCAGSSSRSSRSSV